MALRRIMNNGRDDGQVVRLRLHLRRAGPARAWRAHQVVFPALRAGGADRVASRAAGSGHRLDGLAPRHCGRLRLASVICATLLNAALLPFPALVEVTPRVNLRIPDPIAQGAADQALVPQQLLCMDWPNLLAMFASILKVGIGLLALLLRRLCETPLIVLTAAAIVLELLAILDPDVAQLPAMLPAVAASDVHEAADADLALEAAIARDHGHVVHIERDGPCRQAGLLPLLARRAAKLHGLEGLDHDGGVALATDHTGVLRQELALLMEVLDRALRPAPRALILEELERILSRNAHIDF